MRRRDVSSQKNLGTDLIHTRSKIEIYMKNLKDQGGKLEKRLRMCCNGFEKRLK